MGRPVLQGMALAVLVGKARPVLASGVRLVLVGGARRLPARRVRRALGKDPVGEGSAGGEGCGD
jgi:hypothetical protein